MDIFRFCHSGAGRNPEKSLVSNKDKLSVMSSEFASKNEQRKL